MNRRGFLASLAVAAGLPALLRILPSAPAPGRITLPIGPELNRIWHKAYGKVPGGMLPGFDEVSEEWSRFDSPKWFSLDISAQEITVPVDV